MTAAVLSLCEARRRRAIALRLVPAVAESELTAPWRDLGRGWSAQRIGEHTARLRWGLRERLYEAVRLGRQERPLHCPCCGLPLHRGMLTYRERGRPDERRWRDVRICARCVEVEER